MEISKIKVPGRQDPIDIKDATARTAIATETSRAQAAEQLLQQIYEGITNNDVVVVQELPSTGQANTIYRVIGSDSYSDYAYSGGQWVLLATYSGQPNVFVHLTQQEYDNLSEFEKNNGTYYFVEED